MKANFVNTSNVKLFLAAMNALKDRGTREACLMVVDGIPGLGKTHALNYFATQKSCIFVRAKQEWSASWMMRELLEELRIIPEYKVENMFRQLQKALSDMARNAERNGEDFAVIIDEIDYVSRSPKILETIRSLSDMLEEVPFILIGMGRVRHNLVRFPQIASRIGQYVSFNPASIEDVRLLLDGLCEIKVAPDLCEYLHKASTGLIREIKEGIANIERFGRKNPPKDEAGLTVKEMDGHVLLNDRKTSKPIFVRA